MLSALVMASNSMILTWSFTSGVSGDEIQE
jgi:hypothetical protein